MDISRVLLSLIVLMVVTGIHCRRPRNRTDTSESEPSIGKALKTAVINEIPGLVSLAIDSFKSLALGQKRPTDIQDYSDEIAPAQAPEPSGSAPSLVPPKPMSQPMPAVPGFPFTAVAGLPQFPFAAQYNQESNSGSVVAKCNRLVIAIIIVRFMAPL